MNEDMNKTIDKGRKCKNLNDVKLMSINHHAIITKCLK